MKWDQTSPMKEQEYFSQNIHFYIDIIVDKYGNDYNSDKLRKFRQFYLCFSKCAPVARILN